MNPLYKIVFGLLFDMCRHGLTHGHLIRSARYLKGGKWHFVYWEITEGKKDHLALRNKSATRTWLVVSVPQLVDDTIAAIEIFIRDLKAGGANSRLLSKFKKGYEGMCTTLREPPTAGGDEGRAHEDKDESQKVKTIIEIVFTGRYRLDTAQHLTPKDSEIRL